MFNKMKINSMLKKQQILRFVGFCFSAILVLALILIASKGKHKSTATAKALDFTGIVDSQFSESDSESAMTSQQLELESLKKQMAELKEGIKTLKKNHASETIALRDQLVGEIALLQAKNEVKSETKTNNPVFAANETMNIGGSASDGIQGYGNSFAQLKKPARIHSVSFQYNRHKAGRIFKNTINYVPSGTFAKAVVLGGVDADASVGAEQTNHGAMLFKLVEPGTLPNGKRSHLNGCFVTASAYGDISSERAYVKLNKISCVQEGHPIVDKPVVGWAFFAGKVGIKGKPLMRDSKVVAWAGISGALSGVAQAAQYAQSVQSFGAFGGATSVVPSSNIGAFAGFGGASKAADQLSQYYIKRAEQYHPVIQVGSGNVADIVFSEGFFLHDEPERKDRTYHEAQNDNPRIPDEVLAQINQAQLGQELTTKESTR